MRNRINLNDSWQFIKEDAGLPSSIPAWTSVNLPHTWNAVDGNDGNGNYYRGTCWYAKEFETPKQPLEGGRVFLDIKAAALEATLYINGTKAAYHEGGYSSFCTDITDLCKKEGTNLIAVAVNNGESSNIYPQMADFTFYGGLYRGVDLVSVPACHFTLSHNGGPGIKITPTPNRDGSASFELESWVDNGSKDFTVLYSILDKDGNEVAGATRPSDSTKVTINVPQAHLWDVDDPYLYTVKATLQRRNEAYDEVSARAGVRSFSCDPAKGFFLNGRSLPLRGVSRHQDIVYKGNALTREDHYNDARIIKELGANTIRLAHYQHSQDFYDACDELGFIIWAEIPFISNMTDDPKGQDDCISQMTDLITQNYNHPCICFWGVSNEILIGGMKPNLVENHKELNALCKKLDPTRLTTIAHVSSTPLDSPLHNITDVESYNHYFGWYGGKMTDNEAWLDHFHEVHPEISLGVSEYGCEGIITYHTDNPRCKDYSEEYQALYHEHMAKILSERTWIWSTHVWNMFDFGCAARDEGGVKGRNNKGLVTMDRKTKKDSFYIYQAYWKKEPMLHIAGRRYAQRAGETTLIKVYTNLDAVTLSINGKDAGTAKAVDHIASFTVALDNGSNAILAKADGIYDSITLEKVEKEPEIYTLPEFNERQEGVANWFKMAGSMDLKAPMEFPEGKYSVKDTFEELSKNDEAFAIAAKACKLSSNFTIEPGKGMWGMIKGNTVEGLCKMVSGMPEGFVESINAQLIKISK
ncbi:MAG: hypothetical protein LKF79_00870 [Solobacterium sp.]|jgi:beta-galactosidase|nr:hypothetical protein [Solobacterium sp.]MCH4221856.1 hypothetical protein [Solobacterium sp.]MCH4265179.1 hypothetical protein [Solobacterium sp.]